MLPLKFLREHADLVRADLRKRGDAGKEGSLDEILAMDQEWRRLKYEADQLKSLRNKLSLQVSELKKAGHDAAAVLAQVKEIPQQIKDLDDVADTLLDKMRQLQLRLPNVLHESVPVGNTPADNVVVREFGNKPQFDFAPKNHTELIEALGLVDLERAAKISGSRFYFLKGSLARLELALQKYAVDFLSARGFTLMQPPPMMNRAAYEGVTDLKDFEDMMYKVDGEDLYLIATSEHPLTAQFMNEMLQPNQLPLRLAGISPCFRKEAGAHGKEEKGIWRVHHFNKIEQIIICKPEDSWAFHEALIKNAIEFFESLGLAFRQVTICTADIGTVAAKKYDLEAWIPSVNEYKEIASCSNCTAYQAARLTIRYDTGAGTDLVHTLNSTLVATSRALVAMLEQFQLKDGSVEIPKALRPYMEGEKVLKR